MDRFYRTEILLGKDNLDKIKNAKVLVLGLGGVGGIVVEILARIGIQKFMLVDYDKFDITNLNRQILALDSNISFFKTDVAMDRLKKIDPNIEVQVYNEFATIEKISQYLEANTVDIVVDAIDSVQSKVSILTYLYKNNIPVVSSMGAGFVTNPATVKIADISKTNGCRLARYVRKYLKKENIITGILCVYSDQEHRKVNTDRKSKLGSIATITNLFGIMLAHCVLKKILPDLDIKDF
jgi:tRNA A37 threonylcarbamoyladenosine dehydratase